VHQHPAVRFPVMRSGETFLNGIDFLIVIEKSANPVKRENNKVLDHFGDTTRSVTDPAGNPAGNHPAENKSNKTWAPGKSHEE
jgi:hypothetical protein